MMPIKKWLLQHQLVVAGVLIVLVFTLAFTTQIFIIRGTVYAYTKSVPIQIGYSEAQNYWMLSAVVDETTAFKMVLNAETTEDVDEDTEAKTKSEVGILVEPVQPYSKTNLIATNLLYPNNPGGDPDTKPPAFDINGAGWLTTAVYKLGVWKNGYELSSQLVEVDYQKPKVVYLQTPEGTVTVNKLGMLPQGVEVPSGDLVVVYDPDGNRHIFTLAKFIYMLDKWDDHVAYLFPTGATFDWEDVWKWVKKEGYLPSDVQLVHVSDVTITPDKQYITLTYGGITFAGIISIYVPEDLADTIIVQLFNPIPVIIDVEPSELPNIEEGESTVFYVEVKNTGTEGTVSISVSSTYYSFNPLTETTKNMDAQELFTFKFEAFALNVEKDTDTTSKILAQGRGGTDTYTLKGKILNVEGYTPTIPEPTETTLIIYVVDGNYKGIEEITVSIIYGASTATGMSNVDGIVPEFELGKYTGDVKIVTQETAKYPSETEIITVQLGTNEHTIVLGAVLPWLLIIAVVVIVIVAAVAIYFVMARRRRRR